MLSRSSICFFSLIVASLFFGCTSGRNETTPASASPAPTKSQQQVASQASPPRTSGGHTEAPDGSLIMGEKEHCFQRDNTDTRDLVLTFTDPGVQTGTVSAFIINTHTGTVVEDIPTITKDPKDPTKVNIRFSDSLVPGARRTQETEHLGPGPYMEVTTVDPTGSTGLASAKPKRTGEIYEYITVDDPKDPINGCK